MKKYGIGIILVLIFVLSISAASAQELNATDEELNLNSDDMQKLEVSASENDNEIPNEDILTSDAPTAKNSQAYLVLDNDANVENIHIGEYVTWIVSVINKGPDTAKNVKVYDQLPDGLQYVKHTTTKGTFNPKTGIWNIGDLAVHDGEVFLNITTKALTLGEKINNATITSDTFNLNNETYEEEEIDVVEHERDNDVEKSIVCLPAAGNPIALILLSFFTLFVTSIKSKY